MQISYNYEKWCETLNNFRKDFYQRSFDLFCRQITGLIVSENKTITGCNNQFTTPVDQSNLNRFLTEYPWSKDDVRDTLMSLLKKKRIPSSFSYFILDDTILEKVGKSIDSVGYHRSHNKGYLFGHQVVTSGYIFRAQFFPFIIELYTKKEDAEKEDIKFRTKVEIALDILTEAISFHKPSIVLIDSWYYTQKVINLFRSAKKSS